MFNYIAWGFHKQFEDKTAKLCATHAKGNFSYSQSNQPAYAGQNCDIIPKWRKL